MAVMAVEGVEGAGADVFAAGGSSSEGDALASRSKRTSHAASERRSTALGGSKGPHAPGREAGGVGRTSQGSKRSSGGSKRTSGGKSKGFKLDSISGSVNGGPLLAEYIGGAVIIVLGTLTRGPSQGYNNVMAELMLRMTALTTVFFTLFLFSGTKGGKAAVWFGLLVDLGILFTAATENVLAQTASVIKGTPIGGDVLTDATVATEPTPSITLPSDQPATAATTTAATTVANAIAATA